MSLSSLGFLAFLTILTIAYYLVPARYQKKLLLVASIVFYLTFGFYSIVYIIITSISIFVLTKLIAKLDYKDKKRRPLMLIGLVVNFGLLCIVKYTSLGLIAPIGMSFYTFQATGYLLDVYWSREEAETDYLNFLLFLIYFPQIIQGPISKHKSLATQLNQVTHFDFMNIKYGVQLIVWGLFKKLVIADTLATAANEVLDNPGQYYGINVVIGILAYSAELYGDFSGGIDIIRGASELLGIYLDDNFRRPFFSQSIAEFWRRWHITLGVWMKDYVFYPMALSKTMNKLGKKTQRIFGKKIGKKMPMCIENIVVFLIVGAWHGASGHFIVYGLYNGLIIAISILLEPYFNDLYAKLHIDVKSNIIHCLRVVRTFVLINIGWYFDDVSDLSASFALLKNTFAPASMNWTNSQYLGLFKYQYIYSLFGIIIWLSISILQEKGINVRRTIDGYRPVLKWAIWIVLIFMIPLLGFDPGASAGFMYANF